MLSLSAVTYQEHHIDVPQKCHRTVAVVVRHRGQTPPPAVSDRPSSASVCIPLPVTPTSTSGALSLSLTTTAVNNMLHCTLHLSKTQPPYTHNPHPGDGDCGHGILKGSPISPISELTPFTIIVTAFFSCFLSVFCTFTFTPGCGDRCIDHDRQPTAQHQPGAGQRGDAQAGRRSRPGLVPEAAPPETGLHGESGPAASAGIAARLGGSGYG